MSQIDDGGPAFPRTGIGNAGVGYDVPPQDGLSMRDYFAAAALQGLLATWHLRDECGEFHPADDRQSTDESFMGHAASAGMSEPIERCEIVGKPASVGLWLATDAYELADAMLVARQAAEVPGT